jgi:hypothetical protein
LDKFECAMSSPEGQRQDGFSFVSLHPPTGHHAHVGTAQCRSYDPQEINWDERMFDNGDIVGLLTKLKAAQVITDQHVLVLDIPQSRIHGESV